MTRYYRRKEPGAAENLRAGLVAGALATTVAAVSFYFVRLFLSKEPLEPRSEVAAGSEMEREPEEDEA
jgi:hypothetical protein